MAELFHTNDGGRLKHAEWARRLRDCLQAAGGSLQPVGISQWAKGFAELARVRGADKVEHVLAWLERSVGKPFCPQVAHLRDFRAKFQALSVAAEGDLEYAKAKAEPKWAALAARLAAEMTWPPEVEAHLPELVSRTCERWWDFFLKMEDVACSAGVTVREVTFLLRVMKTRSPTFVTHWFEAVNQKVGRLPHYLGNAAGLAFRPKSDLFRDSFWRAWAAEWAANPHAFDDLYERLCRDAIDA